MCIVDQFATNTKRLERSVSQQSLGMPSSRNSLSKCLLLVDDVDTRNSYKLLDQDLAHAQGMAKVKT